MIVAGSKREPTPYCRGAMTDDSAKPNLYWSQPSDGLLATLHSASEGLSTADRSLLPPVGGGGLCESSRQVRFRTGRTLLTWPWRVRNYGQPQPQLLQSQSHVQ
jgi:hypothetical protein